MSTAVILETERLRLREWDAHYGRLLDQHCNTPEVLRYLEGRKLTPDEHKELVDWLRGQQKDYGITFWVLEDKANNEFLGFCGLVKVDEMDSTVLGATEIGWRVRADRQGHHFASEAAKACMHLAFDKNGDNNGYWNVCDGLRVVSRTTAENEPSWRLISSLCIAAAVPATTALRWLKTLVARGIFVRRADPHDGRRVFVELAPDASQALRRYFADVGPVAVM